MMHPVQWVACEDCGRGRHVNDKGRHAAMAPREMKGPDWPHCSHGAPYHVTCSGRAVVPPCCLR